MFTGLVEETGAVKSVQRSAEGRYLTIDAAVVLEGSAVGDSISVNGACQTVTEITDKGFTVFVSRVTESITTLGFLDKGMRVNLERALSASARLGGHIMQGHVDTTGRIRNLQRDSEGLDVWIDLTADHNKYLVPRGSVAVDGVSLTVVDVDDAGFRLYLIPETLENTIIPQWKKGDAVNVEVDILAKYVERMLNHRAGGDDARMERLLKEEGYM